jgi:hypothetical protein
MSALLRFKMLLSVPSLPPLRSFKTAFSAGRKSIRKETDVVPFETVTIGAEFTGRLNSFAFAAIVFFTENLAGTATPLLLATHLVIVEIVAR